MLVLGRHLGEEIVIDGDIVVQVVEITPGKVKLGVTAPKDVTVHRREVQDQIDREEREREEASRVAGPEKPT